MKNLMGCVSEKSRGNILDHTLGRADANPKTATEWASNRQFLNRFSHICIMHNYTLTIPKPAPILHCRCMCAIMVNGIAINK